MLLVVGFKSKNDGKLEKKLFRGQIERGPEEIEIAGPFYAVRQHEELRVKNIKNINFAEKVKRVVSDAIRIKKSAKHRFPITIHLRQSNAFSRDSLLQFVVGDFINDLRSITSHQNTTNANTVRYPTRP